MSAAGTNDDPLHAPIWENIRLRLSMSNSSVAEMRVQIAGGFLASCLGELASIGNCFLFMS